MPYGFKSSLTIDHTKVIGVPGTHAVDLESSSDQRAEISDANQTGLGITGDISTGAWIKLEQLPSSAGNEFSITTKNGDGSEFGYRLYLQSSDNKIAFQYSDDGTTNNLTLWRSNIDLNASHVGKWIHIAAAADVSVPDVRLYLNGVDVSAGSGTNTGSTSIHDTTAAFMVGMQERGSNSRPFDGQMAEVFVTSDLITSNEAAQLPGQSDVTDLLDNVQGYWKLDNDYTDETANGNDLTAVNSPTFVALSEDHTNFPVLISGTYDGTGGEPDLRTIANGGNIENTASGGASGSVTVPADFAFYSDEAGTTPLDFEIESYNASTGEINAWVEIPTLDVDADTEIWMHYGDSGVTTSQESISGTWAGSWDRRVYHFGEDPSGGTIYDSTGTTNATTKGTWSGAESVAGQIADGLEFDATADKELDAGDVDGAGFSAYSFSCWFKADQTSSPARTVEGSNDNTTGISQFVNSDTINYRHGDGSAIVGASYSFTDTTNFHLLHQIWDGSTVYHYLDGVLLGTSSSATYGNATEHIIGGRVRDGSSTQNWDGKLDEARFSESALSSSWIKTEYNSQNSPSTFYSVGAEQSLATGGKFLALMGVG